jgi:hypothetical protein
MKFTVKNTVPAGLVDLASASAIHMQGHTKATGTVNIGTDIASAVAQL